MKLVIFDCDGTIVDSQNVIVMSMREAFERNGLEAPTRAETLAIVGLSLPEAFAALAPEQPETMRAKLAASYRQAWMGLRDRDELHEPLFPGAREAITALSAREDHVLGIATGKSMRGVQRLFKREAFEGLFSTLQTSDGHPSKPHPAMIEAAMRESGVDAAQTVMLGDTTFDIEMARNAGVASIAVAWGYHPVDWLTRAGANKVVTGYAELLPAIDALLTVDA
ncbi:MAG: HAD-IA family hydrolase [Pseudomonadota bacterium]